MFYFFTLHLWCILNGYCISHIRWLNEEQTVEKAVYSMLIVLLSTGVIYLILHELYFVFLHPQLSYTSVPRSMVSRKVSRLWNTHKDIQIWGIVYYFWNYIVNYNCFVSHLKKCPYSLNTSLLFEHPGHLHCPLTHRNPPGTLYGCLEIKNKKEKEKKEMLNLAKNWF